MVADKIVNDEGIMAYKATNVKPDLFYGCLETRFFDHGYDHY